MAISAATLLNPSLRAGWLVYIGYGTPIRLCSFGSITLLTYDWTGWDVVVEGPEADGTGTLSVSIGIVDPDLDWPARVMAPERATPVSVWEIRALSGASWETEQVFAGTIDALAFAADTVPGVTLYCMSYTPDTRLSPRLGWQSDFAKRRGDEITIGTETYRLE